MKFKKKYIRISYTSTISYTNPSLTHFKIPQNVLDKNTQRIPPLLNQHLIQINCKTYNSTSMQRHLFAPTNIISILVYSKKHFYDFQARKNGAESTSLSPRKKHTCGDPRIRVIPLSTEASLHLQGLSQPIHL